MPKTRRPGFVLLAVGIPTLAVAGVAAWAGMSLIAPGTKIAGVDVSFMTPQAAAESVTQHVAGTETSITVADNTVAVAGSALGASVDAQNVVDQTMAERPLWNIGSWSGEEIRPAVTFDDTATNSTLRDAFPSQSIDPVDASITFQDGEYVVTPASEGKGVDPATVQDAFTVALDGGATAAEVSVTTHEADITTASAEETAGELNTLVGDAGYYVGDERILAIESADFETWVELTPNPEAGVFEYSVTADAATLDSLAQQLPDLIYQEPVKGKAIVNSAGEFLETLEPTVDGMSLESTDGLADAFVAQLAEHNSAFTVEPTVVPAETATVEYTLEVDLSEQKLYVKENGQVVDSWLVSTGTDLTPTTLGHYSIGWRQEIQTMYGDDYVQPDVKWPMYFNGDEAFHGVYWHDNWGTPMSHGCVGMPEDRAKQIYDWAPEGTDVIIRK
ncbi:L,D-transpeptidase family protein [Gulosibacter molinativorax]|nr:L,D-transpeptidase family protein [Gulosibacter molinativorax]QUY61994.1 ErfK/YbiS/YcfS/YnhG family protein [Gulosibacter molinativorax]